MSRVLLIGWDGADWRILDPLIEQGALPNLQALAARGSRSALKSTIPTHSWAAWPSFMTGVNPADHGVYDILETVPGTHKQYPVTFKSIKERTFLADLDAAGKEAVYADLPLTFPPPDIKGKLLAGGVLPKGRQFAHPADLPETLERAGVPWPINGMSWTTFRNRPDAYLDEALDITGKRIRATEWLMDNTDWDFLMSVWVSVDRTQHCLSNYVGPDHPDYPKLSKTPRYQKVVDVYRQLDDALGSFLSRTDESDIVLFISDHGFQSTSRAVHMDQLLKRLGYLEFTASNLVYGPMQWGPMRTAARKVYDLLGLHGKVSLSQPVNWQKTRAYTSIRSTGEGVSINLAGREPDGIVDPGGLREGSRGHHGPPLELRGPGDGSQAREGHLQARGDLQGQACRLRPRHPDGAGGAVLAHARQDRRGEGRLAGRRSPDWTASSWLRGPASCRSPSRRCWSTWLRRSSRRWTRRRRSSTPGAVLQEVVGAEASVRAGVTAGAVEVTEREPSVSDTEADEMEEHLRGLGYLE